MWLDMWRTTLVCWLPHVAWCCISCSTLAPTSARDSHAPPAISGAAGEAVAYTQGLLWWVGQMGRFFSSVSAYYFFFTCSSDASKIIFMLALLCTWHTPCFRAAWVNTIHTLTGPRIPLQDGASPPIRTAYDQLRQWGQSFTRSPICPPCHPSIMT